MKKLFLYLISPAIFFLLSCNNNLETISIEWIVLCNINDINFNETPLEIVFLNIEGNRKTFQLIPNETKNIKKQYDMSLFSVGFASGIKIYIYPDSENDFINKVKKKDKLEKQRTMEIFIYDTRFIEENDNMVVMLPNKNILVYTYTKFTNNMRYTFLSKNNQINLNIKEIHEIDVDDKNLFQKVHHIIIDNNMDTYFYTRSTFPFSSDDLVDYKGLFVKSNLSEDGIILLF